MAPALSLCSSRKRWLAFSPCGSGWAPDRVRVDALELGHSPHGRAGGVTAAVPKRLRPQTHLRVLDTPGVTAAGRVIAEEDAWLARVAFGPRYDVFPLPDPARTTSGSGNSNR